MSLPLDNEDTSSLNRFKRRLEQKGNDELTLRSDLLPRADFSVKRDWADEDFDVQKDESQNKKSWLGRIFWGALVFFLATIVVAVYVLFFSSNIVSSNNIDLAINGPANLRSGDELNLQTTITNHNKVTLGDGVLILTYPTGTVASLDTGQALPFYRQKLDNIAPGGSLVIGSRAVLFGVQNSAQNIHLEFQYHIPDSNAVFSKEGDYSLQIGSSPLALSVEAPADINAGKNFTADLKIVSNAQALLRQGVLKIDYPTGFNFDSADPAPTMGNNLWALGDLPQGVERHVKITGNLSGNNNEVAPFKIVVGLDQGGTGNIGVEYGSLFKTINLKKDFVAVAIDTNGQNAFAPGGQVSGTVNWVNNLLDKVINGQLELFLDNKTVDKRSVEAGDGFYNSLTNSITWDKTTLDKLGEIAPGDGSTGFGFSLLPLSRLAGLAPQVNLRLVFKGARITDQAAEEDVLSENTQNLKIGTYVVLTTLGTYSTGPFKNTGSLPPKVGAETTYTVTWSLANAINDVNGAKVKTVLPPYIKWLGVSSPLDEKINYDNSSRTVVWDLGSIKAGTSQKRTISFQLSLTPSLSQVKSTPNLTGLISFSGQDALTGGTVNLQAPAIDIKLTTDPDYEAGQENVVE